MASFEDAEQMPNECGPRPARPESGQGRTADHQATKCCSSVRRPSPSKIYLAAPRATVPIEFRGNEGAPPLKKKKNKRKSPHPPEHPDRADHLLNVNSLPGGCPRPHKSAEPSTLSPARIKASQRTTGRSRARISCRSNPLSKRLRLASLHQEPGPSTPLDDRGSFATRGVRPQLDEQETGVRHGSSSMTLPSSSLRYQDKRSPRTWRG